MLAVPYFLSTYPSKAGQCIVGMIRPVPYAFDGRRRAGKYDAGPNRIGRISYRNKKREVFESHASANPTILNTYATINRDDRIMIIR